MGNRRGWRLAIPLLLGLIPALALLGYLAVRDPAPVAPWPAPTTMAAPAAPAIRMITPEVSPTPTFIATLASSPASPLAGSAGAAIPSPTATLPATATPAPAWVEVGRWRGDQLFVTPLFTIQGPWRIRWQLAAATEPCQVMIEEGALTPVLLTGAPGATIGAFDVPRGGTFSLMLHNTIPYDVIVEEWRAP